MKRPKEKTVKAEICEIISCNERSGIRRNDQEEARIYNETERELRDRNDSRDHIRSEYEDNLYRKSGWDNTIEHDPWTNEPHLYSYQRWFEYRLKIRYSFQGKKYETEVDYEPDTGRMTDDQILAVTFYDTDPEQILYITEHPGYIFTYVLLGVLLLGVSLIICIPLLWLLQR